MIAGMIVGTEIEISLFQIVTEKENGLVNVTKEAVRVLAVKSFAITAFLNVITVIDILPILVKVMTQLTVFLML